jgi:hypothetical protein
VTSPARPPGAPEPRRRGRLARLLGRGPASQERLVDDGTMRTLARSFDVERGDAAVLEDLVADGHDLSRPVLIRHVFRVQAGADVADLVGGLRADGYDVARPDDDRLTATATVLLTPLSTAQARARMTGLTTRHPVDYLGWEALGPQA